MGVGIFPVFQTRVDNAEFDSDGKALAGAFYDLDELAREARVPPFTAFGDNREVPAGFNGDPDELDEMMGTWDEWFSAQDGLRTVDAILARLAEIGDHRMNAVEEDLKELRRCLQLAAAVGVAFRLEMA